MSFLYKKFRPRKPGKKRAPSPYKRAYALLWAVTSIYVRTRGGRRNGGRCEVCNTNPIQCAYHFIAGRWAAIHFHLDNLCAACSGCNLAEMLNRHGPHDDKVRAAHVRLVGEDRVRWLEDHKRDPWKKSAEELMEIKRELEAKLAKGDYL